MKSKYGPKVDEFMKARSRAFGDQFTEFIQARGLDEDDETWPAEDKADFDAEYQTLAAEWSRKADELDIDEGSK